MIDIERIRQSFEEVADNLARRGVDREEIGKLQKRDEEWRQLAQEVDKMRKKQNEANKKMAQASEAERAKLKDGLKNDSNNLKEKEGEIKEVAKERDVLWRALPNELLNDVPTGGEADYEVLRQVPEELPAKNFEVKNYFELAENELFDIERAAKVAGSRFVYIKGQLARLQMALVSFVFDFLQAKGFVPILPPVMITEEAMSGMGYLEHGGDEIYKTQDDLYLVGTSEQSIGVMHMKEVLDKERLPLRYVGYSSCFRREAGSHGKDVRGILRLHQFDKVEMFSFTSADKSAEEHELLLEMQEKIMQALELPYRVIKLAAKDLGAPSAKTYDIETWIPGEKKYRETHSTSNTTDYQARRLNVRVKSENSTAKAHMLNGTALAMSRTLIALMENHQQADGSIAIPKALHEYLPFEKIEARPREDAK